MSEADVVQAGFAVEVDDELTRLGAQGADRVELLGDAIRTVSARRRTEGRPVPLIRRWADLGSKPWTEWTADEECLAEFRDTLAAVPGRAARMRELELALSHARTVDEHGEAWDAILTLNSEVLAEVNAVRHDEQRLILQGMPASTTY